MYHLTCPVLESVRTKEVLVGRGRCRVEAENAYIHVDLDRGFGHFVFKVAECRSWRRVYGFSLDGVRYSGAIRSAPSNRITEPFINVFSAM